VLTEFDITLIKIYNLVHKVESTFIFSKKLYSSIFKALYLARWLETRS